MRVTETRVEDGERETESRERKWRESARVFGTRSTAAEGTGVWKIGRAHV